MQHTFRHKIVRFFESPIVWGAVGVVAGVSIMQWPIIALIAAWIALTACIWRTDFFEGSAVSSRYLGNVVLSIVVAVLLFLLSRQIPSYLGQVPSIAINNVELHTNPDTKEVCMLLYFRNMGSALAHIEFFQHHITIAGKEYPSEPSVVNDRGDFAANGGGGRYVLCAHGGEAFQQVQNKADIEIDFGLRYRGDSGPTRSLCFEGDTWNYNFQRTRRKQRTMQGRTRG